MIEIRFDKGSYFCADPKFPEFPYSFTPDAKWLAWGSSISPMEGEPGEWRLGKPEPNRPGLLARY